MPRAASADCICPVCFLINRNRYDYASNLNFRSQQQRDDSVCLHSGGDADPRRGGREFRRNAARKISDDIQAVVHLAEADVVVVSGHEKLFKPDKALYDLAAARIGLKPEELLFVDDLLVNVEGARAAGWKAVQFV